MRNRPDRRLPRHGAALLLTLLAAGGFEAGAGGLRTWEVQRPAGVRRSALAFRLVVDKPRPGTLKLQGLDGKPVLLSPEAVVTQADVTKAEVLEIPQWRADQPTHYVIYLYFTPDAAHRLRRFTGDHTGSSLAIVLDGGILMTPIIQSMVESPAMIEGGYYTREAATRVAEKLAP